MDMTGTDLRLSALQQFPNAYFILRDNNYNVPTIDEVQEMLKVTFIEQYRYVVDKFDCNTFSLIFDAFVRQQQYFNDRDKPDAIGQVYGIFPDFSLDFHARNIAYCQDGWWLLEAQTDETRRVNRSEEHTSELQSLE